MGWLRRIGRWVDDAAHAPTDIIKNLLDGHNGEIKTTNKETGEVTYGNSIPYTDPKTGETTNLFAGLYGTPLQPGSTGPIKNAGVTNAGPIAGRLTGSNGVNGPLNGGNALIGAQPSGAGNPFFMMNGVNPFLAAANRATMNVAPTMASQTAIASALRGASDGES